VEFPGVVRPPAPHRCLDRRSPATVRCLEAPTRGYRRRGCCSPVFASRLHESALTKHTLYDTSSSRHLSLVSRCGAFYREYIKCYFVSTINFDDKRSCGKPHVVTLHFHLLSTIYSPVLHTFGVHPYATRGPESRARGVEVGEAS